MSFESKLLDTLEDMDEDHYHKLACERDPKIAYKASIQLIFAHVADFHMYILDCIARKYGHTREELVETIREAPGWETMYIHPVLKEFTNNLELSSKRTEPESKPRRKFKLPVVEPEPEPEPQPQPKIIKKKKPVRKTETE